MERGRGASAATGLLKNCLPFIEGATVELRYFSSNTRDSTRDSRIESTRPFATQLVHPLQPRGGAGLRISSFFIHTRICTHTHSHTHIRRCCLVPTLVPYLDYLPLSVYRLSFIILSPFDFSMLFIFRANAADDFVRRRRKANFLLWGT